MESPDELKRAAVDVAVPSDADEIIDLTDIVERGEIPAKEDLQKKAAPKVPAHEEAEVASLDELMADLRGGESDTASDDGADDFDLDSLLDSLPGQEEAPGELSAASAVTSPGTGKSSPAPSEPSADEEEAVASDEEFDALLQDIVGEVSTTPQPDAEEKKEGEIGLDDLDSLLASLNEPAAEAEPGAEKGEQEERDDEPSPGASPVSHEEQEESDELSMDDLDGLLDSLGASAAPEEGEKASGKEAETLADSSASATSRKGDLVFEPLTEESPDELEGEEGLTDLDDLLDSLMANEPVRNAASPAQAEGSKESLSSPSEEQGNPKKEVSMNAASAEANVQTMSKDECPDARFDRFARDLAELKTACESALADAGARMAELESRLQEALKASSSFAALTERVDAFEARLDAGFGTLEQELSAVKAGAEPDAIRAIAAQELMSEDNTPPYAVALTERLDALEARFGGMEQELSAATAGAEPDEDAIQTIVTRELMSEDNTPPYAAALAERLDALEARLDARLGTLDQELSSVKAGAEPDEDAIQTIVTRELMSESNTPPYAAALTERLDALEARLDARLGALDQELSSVKAGAEPDEDAIQTIVTRELMSESNTPPYAAALAERLDALEVRLDARLGTLDQELSSVKAGAEPDENVIQTIVTRELMSENNTPPYVEGMVNELVNFENRIIALENRLTTVEGGSEKAAAEAAARVIREEMSAMFAELGQGE